MTLFRQIFIPLALATAIASGPAFAQSAPPPPDTARPSSAQPAKPGNDIARTARKEWDGLSTMTRRQWASMKVKWASEKVKWTACNRQVRAQKLGTAERWTAVGKCMMQ